MSSEILASAPKSCCLQGHLHEGEPNGRILRIQEMDTYVSEPETGKANGNIILVSARKSIPIKAEKSQSIPLKKSALEFFKLIRMCFLRRKYFPDVWGHYINSKLLADAFAREGYLVFLPDYFRGDPISLYLNDGVNFDKGYKPGFEFESWGPKHTAFIDENLDKWVEEVRGKYGKDGTKFACTGYCWGSRLACDQLSEKGICSAGAFAHPIYLTDSHMRNLKKPLHISCAEIDDTFPMESRRRAVDVLMEENKKFQLHLFQGVAHGFTVRADLNDPWKRYAKEQAFRSTVEWFNFWLAQ